MFTRPTPPACEAPAGGSGPSLKWIVAVLTAELWEFFVYLLDVSFANIFPRPVARLLILSKRAFEQQKRSARVPLPSQAGLRAPSAAICTRRRRPSSVHPAGLLRVGVSRPGPAHRSRLGEGREVRAEVRFSHVDIQRSQRHRAERPSLLRRLDLAPLSETRGCTENPGAAEVGPGFASPVDAAPAPFTPREPRVSLPPPVPWPALRPA